MHRGDLHRGDQLPVLARGGLRRGRRGGRGRRGRGGGRGGRSGGGRRGGAAAAGEGQRQRRDGGARGSTLHLVVSSDAHPHRGSGRVRESGAGAGGTTRRLDPRWNDRECT
ncbi:MAG: hypothetical protein GEV11_08080 [Streptosporangiales bacterium]|nr:hypothetical protein [Streptosporangiales bacterium]